MNRDFWDLLFQPLVNQRHLSSVFSLCSSVVGDKGVNESPCSVVGMQSQGQVGGSRRAHASSLQVMPTQTPEELLSIL